MFKKVVVVIFLEFESVVEKVFIVESNGNGSLVEVEE